MLRRRGGLTRPPPALGLTSLRHFDEPVPTQLLLGQIYHHGMRGIRQDLHAAVHLLEQYAVTPPPPARRPGRARCRAGSRSPCLCSAAPACARRLHTPVTARAGCRAADAGHGQAAAQLGHLYLLGEGVQASNETALKYFREAVQANIPSGYNGMGLLYLHGAGALRARLPDGAVVPRA